MVPSIVMYCCIAMTNYTNAYICMQNHNHDTIKTSNTVLKKNIPLTLFERIVCERELETEQNYNILTPTQLAITVFLSRSPGLLNRGPGGPASLGHVPQSSIFLQLVWSPAAQSGVPRAPSAGCCFLYSIIFQLSLNFLCTELYNSSTPTQSLPINAQRNMQLQPSLEWHVLIIIERK